MTKRNSKTTFTKDEFHYIEELVRQLEKATTDKQKVIRSKIRSKGLYWSELCPPKTPYTIKNLHALVNKGIIKVVGETANPVSSIKMNTVRPVKSQSPKQNISLPKKEAKTPELSLTGIEKALLLKDFFPASSIDGNSIPNTPGLYCINLRKGRGLPKNFGTIREDGIIYIGQASKSLRERLWEEELNCNRPATFFRSIGAMLGFLPPKGSLYGKDTRNYKFSDKDEEEIRKWMKSSLFVNFTPVSVEQLDTVEKNLIKKYTPLEVLSHTTKIGKRNGSAKFNKLCINALKTICGFYDKFCTFPFGGSNGNFSRASYDLLISNNQLIFKGLETKCAMR